MSFVCLSFLLFSLVLALFFQLMCRLFWCLIFMNLLAICCFLCHHSLLMLIVSHASYFSCKNQSVCMFTLIFLSSFVLVLGFFQPVDYYCLMLLWLQTVPRNKRKKKKNCSSENMAGDALRVAASQQQHTLRTILTDRSHRQRRWFTRSHSLIHFQSPPRVLS